MKSKDRVHAAVTKNPSDRIPIFMWFHPQTRERLAATLEIAPSFVEEVMGNDIKQAWIGNNHAMEGIVHDREGEAHTDDWGIQWVREGGFNQIVRNPLRATVAAELSEYRFPHDRIGSLIRNLQPLVRYRDEYFLGCDISPCLFEMINRLRGMEATLVDLAADPKAMAGLFDHCADFSVQLAMAALENYPMDWLWTGDDVGSQQALMMSPSVWRERIKPYLKRIFDVGKRRGRWVAFHSCGAIRPIIPDLIEIGLDVLNPIQCNCPGMDPLELKREFGKALTFMGGVDTQELLPRAGAPAVRKAAERLIKGMTTDGGGYILAATHTVPPETPMENIFALYEAAGLTREAIFDHAAMLRRINGEKQAER